MIAIATTITITITITSIIIIIIIIIIITIAITRPGRRGGWRGRASGCRLVLLIIIISGISTIRVMMNRNTIIITMIDIISIIIISIIKLIMCLVQWALETLWAFPMRFRHSRFRCFQCVSVTFPSTFPSRFRRRFHCTSVGQLPARQILP